MHILLYNDSRLCIYLVICTWVYLGKVLTRPTLVERLKLETLGVQFVKEGCLAL
jgi:hypothetical protein